MGLLNEIAELEMKPRRSAADVAVVPVVESVTEASLTESALGASLSRSSLGAADELLQLAQGAGLPMGTRGPAGRHKVVMGAPNLEAGLRQQAMAAMGMTQGGPGGLLAEGRQSTASLEESAPPDPLSWIMGRDLKDDIYRNRESGYVPTKGVLGTRERNRQKEEVDALGRKQFKHDYVSEWNGQTSLWIGHRSAGKANGEYSGLMRMFAKELKKHGGYKVKTSASKASPALIDTMYVLFDQKRIKAAESGIKKYLDAMRKGGAERMNEGSDAAVAFVERVVPTGAPNDAMAMLEHALESDRLPQEKELIRLGKLSQVEESELVEAKRGTVAVFVEVFSHNLTRYDMSTSKRESKHGRVNIYRLGLLLEALGKVRDAVHRVLNHDDEAALSLLKSVITKQFDRHLPPAKKTLKQIDEFLAKGKLPSIAKAFKDTPAPKAAPAMAAEGLGDLESDALGSLLGEAGKGSRDAVTRVMTMKSWDGYHVQLGKKDAAKLKSDKEVQVLLSRPFDYQHQASEAGQSMFHKATVSR